MQLLHAKYAVERFLAEFLQRTKNFDVVFWHGQSRHVYGGSDDNLPLHFSPSFRVSDSRRNPFRVLLTLPCSSSLARSSSDSCRQCRGASIQECCGSSLAGVSEKTEGELVFYGRFTEVNQRGH